MPNFTALDLSATLVAAMVQARDAVSRRSWAHPQAPTPDEWLADVFAHGYATTREAAMATGGAQKTSTGSLLVSRR